MYNPFEIVQDSSIWRDADAHSAVNSKDPYLRMGIVKRINKNPDTQQLNYLVEIRNRNDLVEINCILVRNSGGVYNYDDTVLRGYKFEDKPDQTNSYAAKAGDMVLVGLLNGEGREGAIIGFLPHPARKSALDPAKGPQSISEFNGVETTINDLGEYKLTFKGLPTNIKKLDDKSTGKIAPAEYDKKIGGSYFNFDKTGSFTLNDAAESDPQIIKIDKPNGSLKITSGKITVTLTKKDEKIAVKSKIIDINSETSVTTKTKDLSVDASSSIKLKSPKVAIGSGGTELLEQLAKLIDELGKVQAISPVGPCTPLQATPQWPGVMAIQSKIKEITGGL